jgi:hypothetical protein
MNEIRYDGPDLEAETSGRVQGMTMVTMMVGEGLQAGRREARARAEDAAAEQANAQLGADRQLWSSTPTDQLAELTDEQLAARWQATARHPADPQATRSRLQLERELDQRDPQTMRDYRSWRNASAADPGLAMQMALYEREVRLARDWKPLASGQAATLDDAVLPTAWVAALGAHDPGAATAITAGEAELRRRMPDQMAPYDTAVRRGLAPRDAASMAWDSGQDALGPTPTWRHIAAHGVPPVSAIPRTAGQAATSIPPAARVMLAATHRQNQLP